MTDRIAALMTFLVAVAAPDVCLANTPVTLGSDLYLDFTCKAAPSEAVFERFLANEKFRVVNRGRVRRQRDASASGLDLLAYDAQRWRVVLFGPYSDLYTLSLTSPPPTRHNKALEARFVAFVEDALNCKITSLKNEENPADMRDVFDFEFDSIKEDEQSAAVCDKTLSSYDAKRCTGSPGF